MCRVYRRVNYPDPIETVQRLSDKDIEIKTNKPLFSYARAWSLSATHRRLEFSILFIKWRTTQCSMLFYFLTINARDSYRMCAVHGRRGFFSFSRGIRLVRLYTVMHTNTTISFVKSLKFIKKTGSATSGLNILYLLPTTRWVISIVSITSTDGIETAVGYNIYILYIYERVFRKIPLICFKFEDSSCDQQIIRAR